jgi:3-methyladenine DNA glycosylase AlkD
MTHPLVVRIRSDLRAARNDERALKQRAYMKSSLPFYGVPAPDVRRITRRALLAHPPATSSEMVDVVTTLWDGVTHREEWYCALAVLMARRHASWRSPNLMDMYDHMIVTGAWWDVVDDLATHAVRELLLLHRRLIAPSIRKWSRDDHLWRRRAALVCQVGAKTGTDTALLSAVLQANLSETDFFIRKGIGWALRDYSRTEPEWVAAFVDEHRSQLSPLSLKEATKYL